MRTRYLTHVCWNDDALFAIHELEEHLRAVGDLAGEFASSFGDADGGQLVGLWHYLRQYSSSVQSDVIYGVGFAAYAQRGKA